LPIKEPTEKAQIRTQMNILFVVADDLRPEFSVYNPRTIVAPHLAELASRGVVFDRAYCQVSVCCPSRVSMMHGRKPDVMKTWWFERRGEQKWSTLTSAFAKHGWLTLGVGKVWHDPQGPGGEKLQWPDTRNITGGQYFPTGYGPLTREYKMENATVTGLTESQRPLASGFEYVDADIADRAVHALGALALRQNSSGDSKWFLGVGFKNHHLP
jgi:arylsulfatase A-like enzyme